jgi:hypothetical protein
MIRKGGMLCCEIGEPFDIPDELELSQRSYIAALNEQIFGRLGDLLCSEPEQWFGWHNLHKLLPQVCS